MNGVASYKRNSEVEGELHIKDTNGVRRQIIRLEPDEYEQGLGLHIPVDGSQDIQLKNITEKTSKWVKGMESNSLS